MLPAIKVPLFMPMPMPTTMRPTGTTEMDDHKFFTATIQAVIHIPTFVSWLYTAFHHHVNSDRDACVICLLKLLSQSTTNAVTSTSLYNILRATLKSKRDPSEFLAHLFTLNVEGFNLEKNISYGYFVSETTCARCSVDASTYQPFEQLKLEKNKADTVEDAIKCYFKEPYACESCKTIGSTTRRVVLKKTPAVLWIQLEDSDIHRMTITTTIDLTNLIGDNSNIEGTYNLVSMITQHGYSSGIGYYSTVAFAGGVYQEFKDNKRCHIELDSINNGRPYILLYELEGNEINETTIPLTPLTSRSLRSPISSPLMYPMSSTLQLPVSSTRQSSTLSDILSSYSYILSTTMASTLPTTP